MVDPASALPGRDTPMPVHNSHFVLGTPLQPPFPDGMQQAVFGMGCFWGAEKLFWAADGVYTTAVGYAGGFTPNPTYEETCSGRTGHTEAVLVVFDPAKTSYEAMLKLFWEGHDPTQEMRQGNDVGTQYRSALYYFDDAQKATAEASREMYAAQLASVGLRRDHDRVRPGGRVLLRRGLPPAVPGQEPGRLLRAGRDRRELPDWSEGLAGEASAGLHAASGAIASGRGQGITIHRPAGPAVMFVDRASSIVAACLATIHGGRSASGGRSVRPDVEALEQAQQLRADFVEAFGGRDLSRDRAPEICDAREQGMAGNGRYGESGGSVCACGNRGAPVRGARADRPSRRRSGGASRAGRRGGACRARFGKGAGRSMASTVAPEPERPSNGAAAHSAGAEAHRWSSVDPTPGAR